MQLALGVRQLRNGKRADMCGNHQQLCLVHADDEFATDRTDKLGRPRYAKPGRLLGDKADFSLFEGLQEVVIHARFG